ETPLAGNECAHRILHTPVSPLYDGVHVVRVLAESFIHELKKPDREIFQARPIGGGFVTGLIDEVHFRSSRYLLDLMLVIRIRSPGKVVHISGNEVPGEIPRRPLDGGAGFFIPVSDLVCILQHTGSTDDKLWIKGN